MPIRLTERKLRQIIREEAGRLLREGPSGSAPDSEELLSAWMAVYEHMSEEVTLDMMAQSLKAMGLGDYSADEVQDIIDNSDGSLVVDPRTGLVDEA